MSGHYFVSSDIPRENLSISGEEYIKWFKSSEKARRGFCSECGSNLFWDPINKDIEWTAVAMGSIDELSHTKTREHIFVESKGDYYDIKDGLPQFQTTPLSN